MDRFTSHDGVELAYTSAGSGDPVILLHGAAVDAEWNWTRPGITATVTAAGYCAILLDQRGHGKSGQPVDPDAYRAEAWALDIRCLADHLGVSSYAICGYSLGALVALLVPPLDTRAARVVLGGIGLSTLTPHENPPEAEEWWRQLGATDDRLVTLELARNRRIELREKGIDPIARATMMRAVHQSWPLDLDAVSVPALVVTGDEDADPVGLATRLTRGTSARVKGNHLSALDDPALATALVAHLAAG